MTKLNDPKGGKTVEANKLHNSKQLNAKGNTKSSTIRVLTEEESEFAVGAGSVTISLPDGTQVVVNWP
jgi:hypothetical protein